MNREIKFRVWNCVTNSMVDLRKITPLILNQDVSGIFIPDETDGMKIMQYTGLKDKNGKEIYEGDILCFDVHKLYDNDEEYKNQKGIVEMKYGCWNYGDWRCVFCSPIKVIGNIYENPELLK